MKGHPAPPSLFCMLLLWLSPLGLLASAPAASLEERLTAIRDAFLTGDADRLNEQFPVSGRVYISLPGVAPPQFVAPGPRRALLSRIVKEHPAVAFEFVNVPERLRAMDTSIVARWSYRDSRAAAQHSVHLYLSMRRQPDGDWRLVEITASQ